MRVVPVPSLRLAQCPVRPPFTSPVRPNPSLKLTCYGKHCKAGLRHTVHLLSPALQCSPPRAAYLER
jgi:hypothetical protein